MTTPVDRPLRAVLVEVANLRKCYGPLTAVDDVSFTVAAGEVFGLLGPNGAGKTSTLECIAGLRGADGGTVRVAGVDPRTARETVRQTLAIQPQKATLMGYLTVAETLRLWASFYPRPEPPESVIDIVGLTQARDKQVRKLSGGMQQRLLLGVTLVGNCPVLVLDEPAAGLDPQARRDLWDVVSRHREAGGACLLTTHDMNEATALCDRVAIVVGGRIAATGSPAELTGSTADIRTVTVASDLPEARDRLAGLPGVRSVDRQPGRPPAYRVVTQQYADTVQRIRSDAALAASAVTVVDTALDDVFRSLVRTSGPDLISAGGGSR